MNGPLNRECNSSCNFFQPDESRKLYCDARREAFAQADLTLASTTCATAAEPVITSEGSIMKAMGNVLHKEAGWTRAAQVVTARQVEVA